MNQKSDRRVYQPPQARDLSANSAAGGHIGPMGACKSGVYPYNNCVAGPGFLATCGFGSGVDTSNCVGGGYHLTPSCSFGSNAATICLSGANQK
jgi:hypothetical protein